MQRNPPDPSHTPPQSPPQAPTPPQSPPQVSPQASPPQQVPPAPMPPQAPPVQAPVQTPPAPPAPAQAGGLLPVEQLMKTSMEAGASDLYLRAELPPMMRLSGALVPLPGVPRLSPDEVASLLFALFNERQRRDLEETRNIDFAHAVGPYRFRVNVLWERGRLASVMRTIPSSIPTMDDIALPMQAQAIAALKSGLVLVTGPTGSGKTTTLAAILRHINEHSSRVIITIEDPIEFVHEPIKSIVLQREIGRDTPTFSSALRAALREAPDVILVGEMRDLETIETALTAAETGHLVFGTLHTQSGPKTVDRVIDVFPGDVQNQIRAQLSTTLKAVLAQTLLPRADGKGRVAAHELMLVDPAIANMIREGKGEQIRSSMQTGHGRGHLTLDRTLAEHARAGIIDPILGRDKAEDVAEFDRIYKGGDGDDAAGAGVAPRTPSPGGGKLGGRGRGLRGANG